MSLHMLGAENAIPVEKKDEDKKPAASRISFSTFSTPPAELASMAAGGLAGGLLWRAHPVLGLLGGVALGGNAARLAMGTVTPLEAAKDIGSHLMATTSSLALPAYPALGYIAGAVGSSLLLRERTPDGGYKIVIGGSGVGADWTAAPSLADVRAGRATIQKGQRGDSVLYVQGLVGDSAYAKKGFEADGKYGESTETAVSKFQAAKGLSITGAVDASTMAALDKVAGGTGGAAKVDFVKPTTTAIVSKDKAAATTTTTTTTAIVPAAQDTSTQVTVFGRPVWQVALAGAGLAVGGGVLYKVVSR